MTAARTTSEREGTVDGVTVDVLIVSYNTRELLATCIASIERFQPCGGPISLRINVLDNCSSDGTVEMLERRYPAVHLTRAARNEGFAIANNRLAADSAADYLLLLNPDTVWTADIVTPLMRMLRSDERAIIAGPRLISPDGRTQLSSQCAPSLAYELALPLRGTRLRRLGRWWDAERIIKETRQEGWLSSRDPRPTEFLWATCWMIARSDVERYGLFDEDFPLYDEDLDACTRFRGRGRTIVYLPYVELVHIGGASSTSDRKLQLMRTARARYYRRHQGRAAALFYKYAVPLAWRLRLTRARRTPFAG